MAYSAKPGGRGDSTTTKQNPIASNQYNKPIGPTRPGETVKDSTPKLNLPKNTTIVGGGGGGGSSRSSTPVLQSTPGMSTPGALTNPQAVSQAAQNAARTLAIQNSEASREAAQSETNYSLKSTPYQSTPGPFPKRYNLPLQESNDNALVIRDMPGYKFANNRAFTSLGVPFGTDSEAAFVSKQGGSLYGLSSKGTEVFNEVYFANQIQGYQNLDIGRTTGSFLSNQQKINFAKGAYKLNKEMNARPLSQTEEDFTKEFNKGLASLEISSKASAKDTYNLLDTNTKGRLDRGDLVVSGAKLGVAALSFPADLISNINPTFKDGESFGKSNKLQFSPGSVLGSIQNAKLGTSGKAGTVAFIAVGGARGIEGGMNLFKAERASGNSRLGSLNLVAGETAFSLSPIKVRGRIFGVETNVGREVPLTFDSKGFPLKTLKTGSVDRDGALSSLFTSQGESRTISINTVSYTQLRPKLTGLDINRKSLSYSTIQEIKLRPENIASVKMTGEDTFSFNARGKRTVDILTSDVIASDRYNLGLRPRATRRIESFEGFGTGKIKADEQGLTKLGVGQSTFKFKPIEIKTYSGNEYTLKTGGFSGRPSIIRSRDFFGDTAKIRNDFGEMTFGKSRSATLSGSGKRGILGFNTNTLVPDNTNFNFKIGGSNIIGKGSPKTAFDLPSSSGTSSIQLTDQTLKTVGSSSIRPALSSRTVSTPKIGVPSNNQFMLPRARAIPAPSPTMSIMETSSERSVLGSQFRPSLISNTKSSLGLKNINLQSPVTNARQNSLQSFRPLQTTQAVLSTPLFIPNSTLIPNVGGPRYGVPYAPTIPIGYGFDYPQLPSLGGFADIVPRRRGRKTGYNIAPGFTASILNLKSSDTLKVNKTFGVNPFQVRTLQVTKKGKKSNKPYFELVDF